MNKPIHYFLLLIATLFSVAINAQRQCPSYDLLVEQMKENRGISEKRNEIEKLTEEYIRSGGSNTNGLRGVPVYNIPVVVHVVYNNETQNISEAQIQSQIDVLNRDFQLNNSDTSLIPSVFRPLAADCKIQFCLAKRDPNGAATTGIVRVATGVKSFTTNNFVKDKATGGNNAWNAAQYLNLWVCNLANGTLGYAQFPGGAAATDGVVIHFTAFGTMGTAVSPYNLGRTATHEVGHWLNLNHIWGDDGTACTGSDNVGDTPNQAGQNFGSPVFPRISCNNGPNGDMFMNYMDYVNDRAMQMFTPAQKDRMYAILQSTGPRGSIVSSNGCVPPTFSACATPVGLVAGSITQSGATLSWNAVSSASSYTLQYKTAAASTFTTVSGLKSASYTLSGLTAGTGYNFKVMANCSAGPGTYSSVQNFTTQAAVTCSETNEPNNTLSAATLIAAKTTITSQISTKSDVDYFKFSNTTLESNIKVTLTNLPADYDIRLYSAAGALLATSAIRGTGPETITYTTKVVGTYIVQVYGVSSAYNSSRCYSLNVQIGNTSTKGLKKGEELHPEEEEHIPGSDIKVYPNPASQEVQVTLDGYTAGEVTVSIMNVFGTVLLQKILSNRANGAVSKINLSPLQSGVYYIRVQQGNSYNTKKLLVVQS